jgi:hypothetical protein
VKWRATRWRRRRRRRCCSRVRVRVTTRTRRMRRKSRERMCNRVSSEIIAGLSKPFKEPAIATYIALCVFLELRVDTSIIAARTF